MKWQKNCVHEAIERVNAIDTVKITPKQRSDRVCYFWYWNI